MAILTFVRQGITSYIKGGLMLRKAWKTYEKCYKMINEMCKTKSDSAMSSIINDSFTHNEADSTASADINKDTDEVSDECFEVVQKDNGNNDDVSSALPKKDDKDNNPAKGDDNQSVETQSENSTNTISDAIEKQLQFTNSVSLLSNKNIFCIFTILIKLY